MGVSDAGDQLKGLDVARRINAKNDKVFVYQGSDGDWYWKRVDGANGKEVSRSSEGYSDHGYAGEAAVTYNSDLPETAVEFG